jgi:hypothetical protein
MKTKPMRRDLLVLLLAALVVRLVTAALITRPGYMDTAYYATGAIRLAQGEGLSDPFIWNYLDDPVGIPRPGFLYWMPLPALLAAPFAALFPGSFFALQLPFVLLSALLPSLTYAIARQVAQRRQIAWLAGLLMVFSGFFAPYWTLPETFTPFALAAALALWLATKRPGQRARDRLLLPALSGAMAGLAHLTRADGILILPIVLVAPLFTIYLRRMEERSPRNTRRSVLPPLARHLSFVILGYLLVMLPWFARNLALTGAPLPSAGTQTLWLRTYDDLFCYRCDLSLRSYLDWGWRNILDSKLWAAGVNLQRFWAENCLIFLLPFTLLGLYRLRRQPPIALAIVFLGLIYLAHSLAFTFPGPRGGFFHSSAAALPFLNIAAAVGLDAAITWAARKRRWNVPQARQVFSSAAVLLALGLTIFATAGKVSAWRSAYTAYEQIDRWLTEEQAASPDDVTMVGDPPAFWYFTRRPAVAVPNEGEDRLLVVADRYHVTCLVLDANHPKPLTPVYEGTAELAYLERLQAFDEFYIYRINRRQ